MLIPLRDLNPRRRFPAATAGLVAVNALLFAFVLALGEEGQDLLYLSAGAIPAEVVSLRDTAPKNVVMPPFTVVTSMFLHGGWMHIVGNMWFLWLFGDNIEERLGSARFVAFYLLTGTIGALSQCLIAPGSIAPIIGASGAVAGVLGGYGLLFPQARVVTLVPIPFLWHLRTVRAWLFLALWFFGQFLITASSRVAWMAHVGGCLAGIGLVRIFAHRSQAFGVEEEALVDYRR